MELNENLKQIEKLNDLRIYTADLHMEDDIHLNYNEMTFIPEFSQSELNAKPVDKNATLSKLVYEKIGIVSSIQDTDITKITSIDALLVYMPQVYPQPERKFSSISSFTERNYALNREWRTLVQNKLQNFDGYDNELSIEDVHNLDDNHYEIMELGIKIVDTYNKFNTFINTYYNLLDELSISFIHEDERKYLFKYINDYVQNSINTQDFSDLLIKYEKENKEFNDKVNFILTKYDPDFFMSKADIFIRDASSNLSDSSVESFLATKLLTDSSVFDITFTASQKIDKVYYFDDKSLVYRKDNQYHTIKDNETLEKFTKELHLDAVAYLLRKKPKSVPFFQQKILEEKKYANGIKAVQSLLENHAVLKQYNFDLNNFKDKSFEAIDDEINHIVARNKIKQFAYSILSSKYKHHFNDETEPHFKSLYDNNVTTSHLQTFVGRKIAALKDNDDVINMLTRTLNHFDQFTQEDLTAKLESFGIEKIYDDKNIVTFEIKTHEQCQAFGSTSWCIVRDLDYFEQYVTNTGSTYTLEDESKVKCTNRQYIMYDFNKASSDISSMIGFTIKPNGEDYAMHYKNDDRVYDKDIRFEQAYNATLYTNKDRHVLDDDSVEKLKNMLGIVEENSTQNKKQFKQRVA